MVMLEVTVVEEVMVVNQPAEEVTELPNRHILLHEDHLGPYHTSRVGQSKLTFLEPRGHTNHLFAGRHQLLINLVVHQRRCRCSQSTTRGRVDTKQLGPLPGQLTTCTSMGSWSAGIDFCLPNTQHTYTTHNIQHTCDHALPVLSSRVDFQNLPFSTPVFLG